MPRKNSRNKLPRSGLHILCHQLCLELGRRQIAQGRVQAFLVVDLFDEHVDRGPRIGQIAAFLMQHLFVLQRLHERLTRGVVPGIALAAHADLDAMPLQPVRLVVAGILAAAIGVIHQPRFEVLFSMAMRRAPNTTVVDKRLAVESRASGSGGAEREMDVFFVIGTSAADVQRRAIRAREGE